MTYRYFIFGLFYLCASLSFLVHSENKTLPFQRYNSDYGLPATVRAILKSQDGFIWAGTADGLFRFDGYHFKAFRNETGNANSLSHDYIRSMAEDQNGYIWIATGNGLNKFDPTTETITRYQHNPNDNKSLSHNNVYLVFIDSSGQLWVGTENGLNHFDATTETFTLYEPSTDVSASTSGNSIRAITQDNQGNLWIGTFKGSKGHQTLYRFNLESKTFSPYQREDEDMVTAIYFDKHDLWVNFQDKALHRLDTNTGKLTKIALNDKGSIDDGKNIDVLLLIDKADDEHLWLGTTNGLFYKNRQDDSYKYYTHSTSDALSLSDRYIVSILQADGQLWAGTWYGGLNKLNLISQQFSRIEHDARDPDSFPAQAIPMGFAEDAKGNFWILTTTHGLVYWDSSSQKSTIYTHFPGTDKSLEEYSFQTLYMDSHQRLWFGTAFNGLFSLDLNSKTLQQYSFDDTNPDGISGNNIRGMVEDKSGKIWICIRRKGIEVFDPVSKTFTNLDSEPNDKNSLSALSFNFNAMFVDAQNNLWVGTREAGVIRINTSNNEVTRYNHHFSQENALHRDVNGIAQDSRGAIWLATASGELDKIHWENGKEIITHDITGGKHLSKVGHVNIEIDSQDVIWLSSLDSIASFDPSSEQFTHYGKYDGALPGYSQDGANFLSGASFTSRDKRLYFGGSKGIVHFDPLTLSQPLTPFKVVLTNFLLNNRSVKISDEQNAVLKNPIQHTSSLTLSHLQRAFEFTFSALDYQTPKQIEYYYRMLGFDDNWVSTSYDNRRATYTNLDPGNYQFQVKAVTKNGEWSNTNVHLDIAILPAPWKTWWAYSIYLSIIVLIIGNFIRQKYKNIEALRSEAKAVQQKNEQLSLTSTFFENTIQGIWLIDSDLKFLTVNTGFEKITGYTNQEMLGKKINFPGTDGKESVFRETILDQVDQQGSWTGEVWDIRKDGERYPVEIVINKNDVTDLDSNVITHQYIGIFSDVTERKRAEEERKLAEEERKRADKELRHLAYFDSLTQLPNRAQFRALVQAEIDESPIMVVANKQKEFILFYVDIDHFKNINDSLGHTPGDTLLLAVSHKLKTLAQAPVSIARLGGDEFAVLVPHSIINTNTPLFTSNFATKLLKTIRGKYDVEGYSVQISASIGAAIYPQDGLSYEELSRNADAAMYDAKNSGRDTARFYSKSMNEKSRKRLEYEIELRKAIQSNEIVPYFQPKADLQTGEIVGAEVLARWSSEKLGHVSPAEFIPLAEETGQINALSESLLRQACELLLPAIKANLFKGRMAFNVSAIDFQDKSFFGRTMAILKECQFPTERLELEVTEGVVMIDLENAIKTMKLFRRYNIHISLDDFGTGYSSLSYLKKLPLDILKIDMSFIVDITSSGNSRKMANAIITVAHDLGLKVIAEGIENRKQLELLREMKCDTLQGYFLSQALPAKKYIKFLKSTKTLNLDIYENK